jgi:hypothetical protein
LKNKKTIGAYEVRQWCFCPRQWYLFRTTHRKANILASKKGVEFHENAAKPIKAIQKSQTAMATAIVLGGIICLIWLLSLS